MINDLKDIKFIQNFDFDKKKLLIKSLSYNIIVVNLTDRSFCFMFFTCWLIKKFMWLSPYDYSWQTFSVKLNHYIDDRFVLFFFISCSFS